MSQIYLEKCNICFIPFIALKRNILENSDFVLLKEDIHRFISSIELFLRDIRGLRYADLKKVNFFAGHPVGLDPFPDPVGHFGAPWWPFWVLQAVRRCRR